MIAPACRSRIGRRASMTTKTYKGIGGLVGGAVLVMVGGFLLAFPIDASFFHPSEEGVFVDRVSRQGGRIYGLIAVVLGAGVAWLSRRPRWGARGSAIDDYVWGLSQELFRRFGGKRYYGVEEVSRVARESGYEMAYIAYAHAMFCSRSDFDACYGPAGMACTYDGLRKMISRRYFGGAFGFDAGTVVRRARPPREEEYDFCQGTEG